MGYKYEEVMCWSAFWIPEKDSQATLEEWARFNRGEMFAENDEDTVEEKRWMDPGKRVFAYKKKDDETIRICRSSSLSTPRFIARNCAIRLSGDGKLTLGPDRRHRRLPHVYHEYLASRSRSN
jgi:hypothetical protein